MELNEFWIFDWIITLAAISIISAVILGLGCLVMYVREDFHSYRKEVTRDDSDDRESQ